jgi:hypothetical protein
MVERRAMAKVASFRSPDLQRAYVAAYDDVLLSSPVTIAETDVETPYGVTHVLTAGEPGHPVLVALHGKARVRRCGSPISKR